MPRDHAHGGGALCPKPIIINGHINHHDGPGAKEYQSAQSHARVAPEPRHNPLHDVGVIVHNRFMSGRQNIRFKNANPGHDFARRQPII